jgi:threonine synthase
VAGDLNFKRLPHRQRQLDQWARLVAIWCHHFAGYFQSTRNDTERVSFAVQSGLRQRLRWTHWRMMGLPISRRSWPQ